MVEETQTSKILIVDDEEKNIRLVTAVLEHHGYICETALNGLEAIEKTKTCLPDLVLLDLIMPEMDGYEVCKRLKEDPLTQHIPVVMVTNLAGRDSRIKGLNAGAADFLTKPIDRAELLLRVRNLLKVKHFEDSLLMNTQMLEAEVRKKTYELQDKLDEIIKVNTELNLKSKLLDLANDTICLHDLEGNFLYVNEAACRLRGYSRDELMKINLHDLDTPEYAELIKQRIKMLMETGETVFESAHFCKDKSIMPVEVRARIIELDGKKLILSVAHDLTERKRAEEALSGAVIRAVEEKSKSESIIAAMGDGVSIQDTDFKILFQNQVHKDLIGDHVGKYCYMAYEHREHLCEGCPVAMSFKDGKIHKAERSTIIDKGTLYAEITSSLLRDAKGEIIGGIEVVRDITEQKYAQKALDESEKKYRNLVDNALVGIYRTNLKGDILYVNDALARMFEFESPEEMMSESVLARYKNLKDRDVLIENLLTTGKVSNFEVELLTKTGRTITVLLNAILDRDVISGMIIDITERKNAEEKLYQSEERLRRLLTASPAVIFALKVDGKNVTTSFVSENISKLTGYTTDEAIAPNWWVDHLHPEDRERAVKEIEDLFLNGSLVHEYRFEMKDGSYHWFYDELVLIRDTNDNPVEIVGAWTDITERKRTEEQIKRQIDHLRSLHDIDKAITSSLDLNLTLKIVLEEVTKQLKTDAADILLLNPHMQTLEYADRIGFHTTALQHTKLMVGKGFAGQAAYEGRIITIPNIPEVLSDFTRAPLMEKERFISYFATPLIAKGQVKGVLELFHRSPFVPEQNWLDFLDTLATQAAIAIDNAELFSNLQNTNINLILAYDTTIEGWSRALDYRDKETEGHSQRVTEMTVKIARSMGINDAELVHVRRGALLHDIGKMGIPDGILLKPGKLTDEEWELMHKHPVYAHEMLSPIAFLRPALDIPYYHHEKWDGTGYPRGLKGEQIPLSARIFAVVDVWDALRSDRPYRPAWSEEKAKEYILEQSGRHFDPKVVEVFFKFISEQQL